MDDKRFLGSAENSESTPQPHIFPTYLPNTELSIVRRRYGNNLGATLMTSKDTFFQRLKGYVLAFLAVFIEVGLLLLSRFYLLQHIPFLTFLFITAIAYTPFILVIMYLLF